MEEADCRVVKLAALLVALAFAALAVEVAAQDPSPEPTSEPSPEPTSEAGRHNGTSPSPAPSSSAPPEEALRAGFEGGALEVRPNGTAAAVLSVENRLDRPVRVLLAVRDTPEGWKATLGANRLDLPPQGTGEVHLWVRAGPAATDEGAVVVRFESMVGDGLVLLEVLRSAGGTDVCAPEDDGDDDGEDPGPQEAGDHCALPPRPTPEPGTFARCLRESPGAEQDRMEGCCARLSGDDEARRRCPAPATPAGRDHLEFVAMPDGFGLEEYVVDGRLVLERVRVTPVGDVEPVGGRDGPRVGWRYGDEGHLLLHDTATGLVNAWVAGTLELRFPEGTTFEAIGGGWRVRGPTWEGLATAPNATVQGTTLTATGPLMFHLVPPTPRAPAPVAVREMREKVEAAVERGHVGAQVVLPPPQHADDDTDDATVYAFDDLQVNVTLPEHAATPERPILVEFSAELQEGRTIVLDLDPALLRGQRLELRYFDVAYDNGTRHEAEVVFVQAASLEDVLDATDDGIQPEYWVVRDGDGLHILVSVPTWSTHAVTVASVLDAVLQPSVLVGVVAGAGGAVLAAALLLWPRRRRDDELAA